MGVNRSIRQDYPWLLAYPNVFGILERPLIKRTIFEMINTTNHPCDKALVLLGDSPTAQGFFSYDLKGKKQFKIKDVSVDVHTTGAFDEWKSITSQLCLAIERNDKLAFESTLHKFVTTLKRLELSRLSEWLNEIEDGIPISGDSKNETKVKVETVLDTIFQMLKE